MKTVETAVESGLPDLSETLLLQVLTQDQDTVLSRAVRRILDEAGSADRSDVVSAFNAHVDIA